MTASVTSFVSALRHSAVHIWRLHTVSPLHKLVLLFLKAWAISGYHVGRHWSRRHALGAGPEPAQEACVTVEKHSPAADEASKPGTGTRVAVVIPCFLKSTADLRTLRASVKALLANTLPPAFICVVDDCSTALHLSADDELTEGPEVMVLRVEPNTGPARARNAGLAACRERGAQARGPTKPPLQQLLPVRWGSSSLVQTSVAGQPEALRQVVCFTDADCLPSPTWLAEMAAAQARQPGIVCGRTLATQPRSFIGLYHDVFGTLNGRRCQDGSLLYGCTCNLSVDAATVPLAFHPSFPQAAFEDVEFCVRARKQNIALSYNETAAVRHAFEEGPWGLFRQFRRYGRFERHMCTLHPEYLSWLYASVDIPSRRDFAA